ncbi:MAG: hypothetical protein HUU49_00025 [Candidatus Buchananbacteria bacterium]|nr:hypothetical protein [Candidatus Buchananbacteria bacterium]
MLWKIILVVVVSDVIGLAWLIWEAWPALTYVDPRLNFTEEDWRTYTVHARAESNIVPLRQPAAAELRAENVASNA